MKHVIIGLLMIGSALVVSFMAGKFWHWVYYSHIG